MATRFATCPRCGSQNQGLSTQCSVCGTLLSQPMQPAQQFAPPDAADKKLAAGLFGILLGGLGVHKFYLGYKNEGIIMLAVYIGGIALCGIPSLVMSVIGIIEGITYLSKSNDEFVNTYITHRQPWF